MATLDLLRGYYDMLAPLLDSVACAPLPEGAAQRASSLHQRAWLLQLHALELHRADVALSHHEESVQALLAKLFAPDAPSAANGEQPGVAGWLAGWLGGHVGCAAVAPMGTAALTHSLSQQASPWS